MKRGVERLGLLQQPVDQFLGAADRQRRDVVDRLVGIQLGALAAGLRQGIDDVGVDSEKPELEDLKQSHGACADDDRLDRVGAAAAALGFSDMIGLIPYTSRKSAANCS